MAKVNWRRVLGVSSLIVALLLVLGSIYLHVRQKPHYGRLNRYDDSDSDSAEAERLINIENNPETDGHIIFHWVGTSNQNEEYDELLDELPDKDLSKSEKVIDAIKALLGKVNTILKAPLIHEESNEQSDKLATKTELEEASGSETESDALKVTENEAESHYSKATLEDFNLFKVVAFGL